VTIFQQAYSQAHLGIIINDLNRHWLALVGFNIISFLKQFSPIGRNKTEGRQILIILLIEKFDNPSGEDRTLEALQDDKFLPLVTAPVSAPAPASHNKIDYEFKLGNSNA